MGLRRKRKKILLLLLLAGLVCLIVTRSGNYSKTTSSLSAESESCKLAQTYNISGHRIFHKGNQPMLTCKRHEEKSCPLKLHFDLFCFSSQFLLLLSGKNKLLYFNYILPLLCTGKRFCDPEESPQSSPGCVKEDIHDDFIFCQLKVTFQSFRCIQGFRI